MTRILLVDAGGRGTSMSSQAARAKRSGIGVVLADFAGIPPQPNAARVELQRIDLRGAEQRHPVNRSAMAMVRIAGRFTGRGRDRSSWEIWAETKTYGYVRSWVVWRVFRHETAGIGPADFSHVVISSADARAIAWHISRVNPDVTISYSVPTDLGSTPDTN